jgi:cytochrome c6
MKKIALLSAAALTLASFAGTALAEEKKAEALFKEKCAACHPGGGNIMKPKASLKGLKDTKKIVQKIRNGGGGMTAFDQKAISDADAKAVADYIVKTFKK